MSKNLKKEILLLLIFSILAMAVIYYLKPLNQIVIGLSQLKTGWNTFPPMSALGRNNVQENFEIDDKLIAFEGLLFLIICYLSIDVFRKIRKTNSPTPPHSPKTE
ncbi:hypothetical protein EGI22_04385 [Lacihabitans sp. LS3-19]|uniref:hypothetical protein n=1 Tax=Lacihabitans sp. LS3-19 TaxID=2487335 RepID=UPI0020CEA3BE|nr:hypothetical protein [Lacihabitans sp. LS3-19]MCP9767136.1 hypothetical protein [Lacihabitans sp. LS3-19]